MMKNLCFLGILSITIILICLVAQAQNAISTGSISGQVTDSSGAAVVGAAVTAENIAAGVWLNRKAGTAVPAGAGASRSVWDVYAQPAGARLPKADL